MTNSFSDGVNTVTFTTDSDFDLSRHYSYKAEEVEKSGTNVSENKGRRMTIYRISCLLTTSGGTTPLQKADALETLFSDCDALTLVSTAFLSSSKSVYVHTYDVVSHEEAPASQILVAEIEAIEAR